MTKYNLEQLRGAFGAGAFKNEKNKVHFYSFLFNKKIQIPDAFFKFCIEEPRLKDLFIKALAIQPKEDSFCANEIWYEDFKPDLIKLIGWFAKKEILKTSLAYDICYQTIYEALPDCKNCGCIYENG